MNVIILGCGRLGAELAYRLYQKGYHVSIIDLLPEAFDNLHPDFRGRTITGEGLSQDVLHRAGEEEADGLAAVTNSDTFNAVAAHVALSVYHVPRAVVRNYDPRWRSLHEAFGLQVISSTSWGAQRFEEMLHHNDVRTVFSAGNGEVEIYEIVIPAAWHGRRLGELLAQDACRAVALTRAGRATLPLAEISLEAGDMIHLSATDAGIEALYERLKLQPGGK